MVWGIASLEIDRERLERLFPARASGPDVWAGLLVEVAYGEVEHLQGVRGVRGASSRINRLVRGEWGKIAIGGYRHGGKVSARSRAAAWCSCSHAVVTTGFR